MELQATSSDAASTRYFPVVHYVVCTTPRPTPATGMLSDPLGQPPLGLELRPSSSMMRMSLGR